MTEQELQALKNGDQQQFAQLVRSHHRALLALATPITGQSNAEEVVQNAWLKAYKGISRFEGRANIRTWLGKIVINEARMKLRASKREFLFSELACEDDNNDPLSGRFAEDGHWNAAPCQWDLSTPENLLSSEQLADCLQKLLETMPLNQRTVLEMKDTSGFSFEEICNELALSASNVRVILHRARSQLFKLVDHYEETGEC